MSTLRQMEANRRNAQKSTGPTSVTGKATSSMNALRTGIHAKSLVLPTEKLADLQQLIDEYYQSHHPASSEARVMLDDLIRCEWTLRRLSAAETQLFEYAHQEAFREEDQFPLGQSCMDKHKAFGQLQWRIDSTRRALYRALQTLQQLEAAPAPAPPVAPDPPPLDPPSLPPSPQTTSPQIGFVPSTPTAAPGTDQTDMDFRRTLPEIRCQSGLSPVSPAAPSLQLDLVHQN
jgi:hypothetical protein